MSKMKYKLLSGTVDLFGNGVRTEALGVVVKGSKEVKAFIPAQTVKEGMISAYMQGKVDGAFIAAATIGVCYGTYRLAKYVCDKLEEKD